MENHISFGTSSVAHSRGGSNSVLYAAQAVNMLTLREMSLHTGRGMAICHSMWLVPLVSSTMIGCKIIQTMHKPQIQVAGTSSLYGAKHSLELAPDTR
eukprot:2467887-Amphidinium_carterae.1